MTQNEDAELDDAAAMVPVPIHERWATDTGPVVVIQGPTFGRIYYLPMPRADEESGQA